MLLKIQEKKKNGQVSLEYLIVVSIVIAFTAIIFYFSSFYATDSIKIAQAQDSVNRLAATADYVYSLGPNSKDYVTIYLPENILYSNISGNRIHLKLTTADGDTDIFAETKAPELIGSLPQYRGKQKVLVQYLPTDKIMIGELGLSCLPNYIITTASPGDSLDFVINITNNLDRDIEEIEIELNGSVAEFSGIKSTIQRLPKNSSASIRVLVNVPLEQPLGIYGGYVLVRSENEEACFIPMTVRVQGEVNCALLCAEKGYLDGVCRLTANACIQNKEDYIYENDQGCSNEQYPRCCCSPTKDKIGPVVSWININPATIRPNDTITITALCNDSGRGSSYIAKAEGRIDSGPLVSFSAVDGNFYSSVTEEVTYVFAPLLPGQHIAEIRCTDSANNTGEFFYYYFNVSMTDVYGPIITQMILSDPRPTTFVNLSVYGVATDVYTGNNPISMCMAKVDDGEWFNTTPSDGAFDSPTEDFEYSVGYLKAGMHYTYSRCIDSLDNLGGIYNQSFGIYESDIILIIDVSGSMADPVISYINDSLVSTTSTELVLLAELDVQNKAGNIANVSVRGRANETNCAAYYEIRIMNETVANRTYNSTTFTTTTTSIDISNYALPFKVSLYMKKIGNSPTCSAQSSFISFQQLPTKMLAIKEATKIFVDLIDNSTQIGLVPFSTSASVTRTLMLATLTNKQNIKNAIDSLSPQAQTCIECGINKSVDELTSVRSRYPSAVRIAILFTDGVGNVGNSIRGATYARKNNVTVYTIGYGSDVNEDELLNIALLTGGKYYFAPDPDTLNNIYRNIGR